MSALSTLHITRDKALAVWAEQTDGLPSNEELERFLDDYLRDRLYNCVVVDNESRLHDNDMI